MKLDKCFYRIYIEAHPEARDVRCSSCEGLDETCEDYIPRNMFAGFAYYGLTRDRTEEALGDNFPII